MTSIRKILFAAVALITVCSCEGDITIMSPKPDTSSGQNVPEITDSDVAYPGDDNEKPAADIVFEAAMAELYRCGDDYGQLDFDYCDWYIMLYSGEADTDGHYVELDFFTEDGIAGIPCGTFSIKDDGTSYLYEPGCAIPYYYDEELMFGYGCHYGDSTGCLLAATGGSISIELSENGIKIAYQMHDDNTGASFSGIYEGECTLLEQK